MRKTVRYFSIFTFLCVISWSVEAAPFERSQCGSDAECGYAVTEAESAGQAGSVVTEAESAVADSLLFEAVLFEREAFTAKSPALRAEALSRKADLCLRAGNPRSALSALERIPMFALSPSKRTEITSRKALCAYLDEDYDAALSYLAEAGKAVSLSAYSRKSEAVGMALGFVVPVGYAYAGASFGETLLSTLLNAASITWAVTQIGAELYITGGLGGAIALSSTFLGAQKRISTLILSHNAISSAEAKRNAAIGAFSLQ